MYMSIVPSACGKRLLQAAVVALAVAVAPQAAMAINASPHPVHVTQPDGTEIVLRTRGDERFHWEEDANGYTVLFDGGRYVYARRGPDGNLTPTDLQVGQDDPRAYGLAKRVLPAPAAIDRIRANAPGSTTNDTQGAPEQTAPAGTIANLVIPIRFSNHGGRTVPSEDDLGVLFNNVGPHATLAPTGSLRDVYLDNSYGAMALNSTIADWATVSNTEQYYANGVSGDQTLHQALIEALNAADAYIDFSQFDLDNDGYIDSITFLHSGYGAEWGGVDVDGTHYDDRIWSHRWVLWDTNGDGIYVPALDQPWTSNEGVKVWDYNINPSLWATSGSNIGHVGVIAHETGHLFDLPDLYDTNGGGAGIGSFGLMANSWGFDGSQLYPPHMSPWSKTRLGWLAPTTLSAPGTYSLQAVEDFAEVYRIDQGFPSGEYLLIENRQAIGFDGDMPQDGLAIWHIDEQANDVDEGYPGQIVGGTPWPENGRHYRVALLQADGNYNLERRNNRGDAGDVWHGDGVAEINGTTLPSTDTYQDGIVLETGNRIYGISGSQYQMTFDYGDGVTPPPPLTPPAAPTGLVATADGAQVDLVWNDNADNEDGYLVFRDGVEISTLPANSTAYSDSGVPAGWHAYFVRAHNGAGTADSNTANVEVILPAIVYASGESTSFGTLTNDYVATHELAGEETITETESKGRNKTSRLDHTWQVDGVAGGALVMLHVNAHAPANSELDDFEFDLSTDGGASYQTLFTLVNGNDEVRVVELPLGTSGTVFVRVRDSNRSRGNLALDSVSVRQLYIESSSDMILIAPSNLVAAPLSDSEIELTWDDGTGETGYDVGEWIDPNWIGVGAPLASNATSMVVGGLAAESSHIYRVCGFDATSATECSSSATATTYPAGGLPLTLSATGFKVKGRQHADLVWNGGNSAYVDVYRDDFVTALTTTANDGAYTDNIENKGGGSYVYIVCEAGTSTCSNTVTVTF